MEGIEHRMMSFVAEELCNIDSRRVILDVEAVMRHEKKYWKLRRFRDVTLSVLALAVLWPMMLMVALAIVMESSEASPIFTQTRVGQYGKLFKVYKFRSMVPHAEERLEELLEYNEMDGPVFKIKNDPRITKVGKFLRMTGIDELPQLWNVVKGEMSLVGPRPAILREVEQYDDYAKQRLLVTPGLTCYWQIQPNRNRLSFAQWLALDMKYIKERSFLVDWKILLKTFGAVVGMNGE